MWGGGWIGSVWTETEILNPAAFCRPSPRLLSFSELCSLDVSQCADLRSVSLFHLGDMTFLDYVRVSWSQISTQGGKKKKSQLVVIPQRGTDGGKVGVTKPQERPLVPLWSSNCGRNNSEARELFIQNVCDRFTLFTPDQAFKNVFVI